MKWDIFCKAIDNFGDVGVCWRLARQLTAEHGKNVRLWVDAPEILSALYPGDPSALGVTIVHWDAAPDFGEAADVVIEAFACAPPESYLTAMAARDPPSRWINLEYLSAEEWVHACHALPSPHPRLPLRKYFFFPGFTPQTGGLPREKDLFARQRAFRENAGRETLLRTLLAPSLPALNLEAPPLNARVFSLFCYETAPARALFEAWRRETAPVFCLTPPGKPRVAAEAALRAMTRDNMAHLPCRLDALHCIPVPFLPQADHDRLLCACDLNFVRGEDSFVRAQWAARPFVWQIYPQEEAAHAAKLEAFLKRFTATLPETTAQALRVFWHAWNGFASETDMISRSWPAFSRALPELARHTRRWRATLARQKDLATALTDFCRALV
ncbi:MAG: elongation factor P maturation arginine rhamnosyltransferase EarP [Zoogloeaceae bacterium]|jgi:uncharacterized repeat protein (TIGR03837 family)|nr:elongation factor P maturation arginine rhamnosyltransferase EarP [Zoogloeaceae bacterium]